MPWSNFKQKTVNELRERIHNFHELHSGWELAFWERDEPVVIYVLLSAQSRLL